MNRFFVYALVSEVDGRIYVGFTQNVGVRLKEHNAGKTRSTKGYLPWQLLYQESVETRIIAREREKYLKAGQERNS